MIRVAIAGVGNCAAALLQAVTAARRGDLAGLMRPRIGRWRVEDISIVAAFDVDRRKVGLPLGEAAAAAPNCTGASADQLAEHKVLVQMAPVMDGIAPHMSQYPEAQAFRVASAQPVDIAAALREARAEILLCYLPVGSVEAVGHFAAACLEARVALVNCVPVFIASEPAWATRFAKAGLPLVGDDVKSQLGATILHRTLAQLFDRRSIRIERTYQLNTGGNTDFLNMLAHERLSAKRRSKTQAVQSALRRPIAPDNIHIGPSDYVPWQKDNKICFLRIEGRGLNGSPVELEMRLSVQDSPNSAGVVVDAIRCAKLALDRGVGGALLEPSAAFMKSPPRPVPDLEAEDQCDAFIARLAQGGNA
jgi:myo-inositol-1-phosphate synthase